MKLSIIFLFLIYPLFLNAKIKIVSTTPDIAWLVKQMGGDKVEVVSLLNGTENPHYADAMPHWISKVSNADIFCFVGMDLEIGWAPKLLSKSGNAKVQSGSKGHCNAGKSVKALDIPKGRIDRSMGDVHGEGNPHYHLGPSYFLQAADSIFSTLVEVDPKETEYYTANLTKLITKIEKIKKKVSDLMKSKTNLKIISYHKEFSYFFKDFGLTGVGEIEETPGVPPSAGRIARIGIQAKRQKVDMVLATNSNPKKLLNKFNEISGVPVAIVPLSLRTQGQPKNYEELLMTIANTILAKAK